MSEDKKELWLDLHCLIYCSYYKCLCHEHNKCPNGEPSYLSIYFEYSTKHEKPLDDTHTYLLRKTLRALGHKIVRWIPTFDNKLNEVFTEYITSITEEEAKKNNHWNEWVGEVCKDEYI